MANAAVAHATDTELEMHSLAEEDVNFRAPLLEQVCFRPKSLCVMRQETCS